MVAIMKDITELCNYKILLFYRHRGTIVVCFEIGVEQVAKSASERVKNQREIRLKAGWHEIRVWVPSKSAAKDLKSAATKLRADAEMVNIYPDWADEMDGDVLDRAVKAIQKFAEADYVTPSGAVLTLLTDLASEGKIKEMSQVFRLFAWAQPANADFVASSTPAKVLNGYFHKSLGLSSGAAIFWTEKEDGWAHKISSSIWNTDVFEATVLAMAEEVIEIDRKTEAFRA